MIRLTPDKQSSIFAFVHIFRAITIVGQKIMKIKEPFLFLESLTNGQMAWFAYEKMWRYFNSTQIQLQRIYELWGESSRIKIEESTPEIEELFLKKKKIMEQVISDIHFLTIALDKVWKFIDRLTGPSLCPELVKSRKFKKPIRTFMKPYLKARDTFEHYDDQVLGGNSKQKGPGSHKISLKANKGFAFGNRKPIKLDETFYKEFCELIVKFDECIFEELTVINWENA